MRGRDTFNDEELAWIREHLGTLRRAERDEQKQIRGQLRRQGFWITDWTSDGAGFTANDLDELVRCGRITVHRDAGQIPPGPPPVDGGFGDLRHRGTTAHADEAVAALAPPGMPIEDAFAGAVPDAAGLYALHADPPVWQQLGLSAPGDDRPLYVGKAEASLVQRDLRTHFASGRTGQSSPRRSFAALLAAELQLMPIPPATCEPRTGEVDALRPASGRR